MNMANKSMVMSYSEICNVR